jgi:TetR/AcrR family transcriptional repressor of nem operon
MRVSCEQAAANRQKILDVAGTLFRERGFDGTGVDDIMKRAGLTHGGFYGHFGSKDDLAAETCTRVMAGEGWAERLTGAPNPLFGAVVGAYLSPRHRDAPGRGCLLAALGSDVVRQPRSVRRAFTEGLRDPLGVGELGVIAGQALRLAIFGDKFHRRALQVTDDRVIPMALAKCLLIDADVGDRPGFFPGLAACDRATHHAPGFIPTDADNLARALHRAALQDQIDNQPLHQQRKAAPWLGPGDTHLFVGYVPQRHRRHTSITQAAELGQRADFGLDKIRAHSRHRSIATLMLYVGRTRPAADADDAGGSGRRHLHVVIAVTD